MIYIISFFRRLWSVRLIRREQGSLSVGKNFGLAKTLMTADALAPYIARSSGALTLTV